MAVSPSSSVQRARQQLAERLRDLRLDAGLTARALSVAAGWHEAKTSRITLYVRAFEKLAELAVYGTQARGLITAAIDTLG